MISVQPLSAEINAKLMSLGKQHQEAKKSSDFFGAEKYLLAMWQEFPTPKYSWDWSENYLKSLANFYLEWRNFLEAERWAQEVFKCDPLPNDPGPYILLGKIYMEWGKEDLARENLVKAYEMGGRRGFVGEDPKYLKFAQTQMKK